MHIYAVKVQQEGLSGSIRIQRKALTVPAGTAGQEAGLSFTGGGEILEDAEIMRQIDVAPLGVVKILVRRATVVAQVELPALVEIVLTGGGNIVANLDGFRGTLNGSVFGCDNTSRKHGEHHNQNQHGCEETLCPVAMFHK
jgi:hypothetical protein